MMRDLDNNSQIDWTLEIVPAHADRIGSLSELIDEIYITMIPGTEPTEILGPLSVVKAAGFMPVPHIAARSFASEKELRFFCNGLRDHAIEKVLLVAGGLGKPNGPFTDSLRILQSKTFQSVGLSTIALAGHPEGNPVDPSPDESLREKLSFLHQLNIKAELVTQWSFSPEKVNAYLKQLKAEGVDVPVRVGVPGPASLKTLLKYARICGVTATTEIIKKQGLSLGRLLLPNDPDKFVRPVDATQRFHLYPFGGIEKCADWLQQNKSKKKILEPV